MNGKKRRDFLQNTLITLLTVSAVLLFAQIQLTTLGADGTGLFRFLSGSAPADEQDRPSTEAALSGAVRVAVTGPYGRRGSVALSTADEGFESLRSLLEGALDSAGAYAACTGGEFLSSLNGASVYYDFLTPLPLSLLAELTSAPGQDRVSDQDSVRARYLAVVPREGRAALYLWDGGGTCLRCDTGVSLEELNRVVENCDLGGVRFALDDPGAQTLNPCSLFAVETPVLPVLECETASFDTASLLTALRFNPNTKSRYPESGGTEVIVEGGRSLRLRADGSILYRDGGDEALSIDAAGEVPTLPEAASGAAALLGTLFSPGDAALYLEAVSQSGETTVLSFGLQSGGVPIRFGGGGSMAEVKLRGPFVSELQLRLRRYSASGEASDLLPLRQTLAIAASREGKELSIGYADSGERLCAAAWLTD